jgi:hypothetical protein
MQELADFIARNHLSVVTLVGVAVCGFSLLKFAVEKPANWLSALLVFFGSVVVALPFVRQAEFGPNGAKLITSFQENTEDLKKAVAAQAVDIEKIQRALGEAFKEIKFIAAGSGQPGALSPVGGGGKVENLDSLLLNLGDSVVVSKQAIGRIENRIIANDALIKQLRD